MSFSEGLEQQGVKIIQAIKLEMYLVVVSNPAGISPRGSVC